MQPSVEYDEAPVAILTSIERNKQDERCRGPSSVTFSLLRTQGRWQDQWWWNLFSMRPIVMLFSHKGSARGCCYIGGHERLNWDRTNTDTECKQDRGSWEQLGLSSQVRTSSEDCQVGKHNTILCGTRKKEIKEGKRGNQGFDLTSWRLRRCPQPGQSDPWRCQKPCQLLPWGRSQPPCRHPWQRPGGPTRTLSLKSGTGHVDLTPSIHWVVRCKTKKELTRLSALSEAKHWPWRPFMLTLNHKKPVKKKSKTLIWVDKFKSHKWSKEYSTILKSGWDEMIWVQWSARHKVNCWSMQKAFWSMLASDL